MWMISSLHTGCDSMTGHPPCLDIFFFLLDFWHCTSGYSSVQVPSLLWLDSKTPLQATSPCYLTPLCSVIPSWTVMIMAAPLSPSLNTYSALSIIPKCSEEGREGCLDSNSVQLLGSHSNGLNRERKVRLSIISSLQWQHSLHSLASSYQDVLSIQFSLCLWSDKLCLPSQFMSNTSSHY